MPRIKPRIVSFFCLLAIVILRPFSTFTTPSIHLAKQHATVEGFKWSSMDMLPEGTSLMTAVEVFDGSSIVDPVIVSDVFWSSLKGKVLAVAIGNILATIVFGLIAWFVSSRLSQFGDMVMKSVFKDTGEKTSESTFIRADQLSANRPAPDLGKLLICLVIDILGSSSEIVPILGELTDLVYAPVAGTLLRNLFGNNNILFGLEFAEEILPFTDVLPLATICWVIDAYFPDSGAAKLLKLGDYSSQVSKGVIDVDYKDEKR